MYQEVPGDLIEMALDGKFDVVVHGCNCRSRMENGVASQLAKVFGCDLFDMELRGPSVEKLGNIDHQVVHLNEDVTWKNRAGIRKNLVVVNAYTQDNYGANHPDGSYEPFDYEAFVVCMRKVNIIFSGKKVGMPKIGSGLAGGDWKRIRLIVQDELRNCDVTVVIR